MKITYDNKVALSVDETIDNIYKIRSEDINEIKNVVNVNDDFLNSALADIEEIKNLDLGDTMPIGSVIQWFGDVAPQNWLVLDGKEISRTDYFELFEIYGTKYGEGDGISTFNLPDLRDYVPVGKSSTDTNINELGQKYGEKTHTLIIDEMPNHNHEIIRSDGGVANEQGWGSNQWDTGYISTSGTNKKGATMVITNTGGSKAHNNMQPSIAVNFIVKVKMSAGLSATVIDDFESSSSTDALSANKGRELRALCQNNIITASDTSNYTTTTTFNYEKITVSLKTAEICGSKLSLDTSSNAVIIGPGVSKVLATAKIDFPYNMTKPGELDFNIEINGETKVSGLGNKYSGGCTNISLIPKLLTVKEGDKISLSMGMSMIGEIGYRCDGTYLTIEVVE